MRRIGMLYAIAQCPLVALRHDTTGYLSPWILVQEKSHVLCRACWAAQHIASRQARHARHDVRNAFWGGLHREDWSPLYFCQ